MRLTIDGLREIERVFGIPRDGPWNKLAVSYVGLSFPLSAGWKVRLVSEGAPDYSPVAAGVSPHDWLWLHGRRDDDEDLREVSRKVDPHQYVLLRVAALEIALDDIKSQVEGVRKEARELRDMISKDDW